MRDNNNMDRTRRSTMPANPLFPRRRHPTISLRSSSQEDAARLKAKRRRACSNSSNNNNSHSTEEESVGNEQDARMHSSNTASSAPDQVIGAAVPRRTRSASVKRPYHSLVEEQSGEAASPSSYKLSLSKKRKPIGSKTGLPSPSPSNQEDIEIEIAELLYGLRASQNHGSSSSQKVEASDSRPARSTSPTDVEKKKVEDYSSSCTPNISASETVRNESAKMEKASSESPSVLSCHGIESPQGTKQDIEEDNLNSRADCGDTADGRSKSKLDVDKHNSTSSSGKCDDVPGNSSHRKFEIDLMAPPPLTLYLERDNLSRGEDNIKVEDKVENFIIKETMLDEIEEVQKKVDSEKLNKHNNLEMNLMGEQDRSREQPTTTSTNPKLDKTDQCSSKSLSTAVSERSSSLSPLGYMPPLATIVKTDKTVGFSKTPQHGNFVLSQPRPKRCATHDYIARNIFMHQQYTKMNTLLPSAIGDGSLCGTKPDNVNQMHSAESVVIGKHSHKRSPGVNQNAAPEKGRSVSSDFSLAAIKSSGPANPMDLTQMKQLVLQQGPYQGSSGSVMGPGFLIHPGQHQASIVTSTSQAGGLNNASSSSSCNKFQSSAAGSLGTTTLPAVAAAMSFSYPNLAANGAPPYMTIVPNSGYPFPFSTPLGASAAIRGASPAQSTPVLSGPLYSSQIFHPLQYPHHHPHSQPLIQPSYLNASTSSVSSSSHKQHAMQGNSNDILSSTTMQLQQSQKQHNSQSHPHKHETGMSGENAPSAASGTAYSQKNGFGQNLIPVRPLNLSFTPSAALDSVGGNSGNFGDRQQQKQASKGAVEHIPSPAYAISFASYNGASVPSNLNLSTMAQNPVIFQSLPDIAWQGYHAASTSHMTRQKMYPIMEGKSGGSFSHRDDEKKAVSGKPSTNVPTTLVFDNSSKNLNFFSSPMNGNWPSRSTASTATTTSLPLCSNVANSQQPPQLLHLQQQQQQHGMFQQQPAVATRYKASSTNAINAAKDLNTPPVFSQTQTQCKSSNQGSQPINLVRTSDYLVHNPSIIPSTTPTLQTSSLDQGRVQGHTQISFGGNYISSPPLHGQQLFNNNQSPCTAVTGTPPSGGNSNTNSHGSKVSSSVNTSQMQQTENSLTATGQKSSPVCGRNVSSILTSCPSHLSEMKY